MGFLIFLFLLGAVALVLFAVMAVLALLFGGEDPYEKQLRRMDWEDEVLSRMDDLGAGQGDRHYHLTDARQIHLHRHEYKAEK